MRMHDHLQARHLVRQAGELAGDSRGRPRQVDLRRAVSGAYYAVYHELTLRSASHMVGYGAGDISSPPPVVVHLVRWFSHASVVQAARLTDELRGDAPSEKWKPGRRAAWELLHDRHPAILPDHLIGLTEIIRDLQEQRHTADYDHVTPISRQQATDVIAQAERALESLAVHATSDPYLGFLTLVALCNNRLPAGV